MTPLRVAPQLRLQFVFIAVLIFASSVTPLFSGSASAAPLTLPAPEEKVLSLEEQIDGAFGQIVSKFAAVLLWDVAFWDNDAPQGFSAKSPLGDESLLVDPLGWSYFSWSAQRLKRWS